MVALAAPVLLFPSAQGKKRKRFFAVHGCVAESRRQQSRRMIEDHAY
jgi:hypothetical protein